MDWIVKFFLLVLMCSSCQGNINGSLNEKYVTVDTLGRLIIYTPYYNTIEFAVSDKPDKTDTSIIFCCTASFTKARLLSSNAYNVAGPYAAEGGYHSGYMFERNNMAFVYYNDSFRFVTDSLDTELKICAEKKGRGFSQIKIDLRDSSYNSSVPSGKIGFHMERTANNRILIRKNRHRYRALCEKGGVLFIAEAVTDLSYHDFKKELMALAPSYAIYLDVGLGWSYGWYLTGNGQLRKLHWFDAPYVSNWLIFRR